VDCIAPQPGERITDPACGTGGFLFTAHNYITSHNKSLTRAAQAPEGKSIHGLRARARHGPRVRHGQDAAAAWTAKGRPQGRDRQGAIKMMLHGIGSEKQVPVVVGDALAADPGERYEVVMVNPPFGKKSSTVIVGEDGRTSTEKDTIERDDFWATNRRQRQATWSPDVDSAKGSGPDGRWRAYNYDELVARDKTSLGIFWLKDDSLADSDNLPAPGVIAQEIVEDLQAALEQFKLIAADMTEGAIE